MSADQVDDVHAAEDFAGSCVALLEELLPELVESGFVLAGDLGAIVGRGLTLIESWDTYCRPTCGFLTSDEHECDEGGEDAGCGCPCDHQLPEGEGD